MAATGPERIGVAAGRLPATAPSTTQRTATSSRASDETAQQRLERARAFLRANPWAEVSVPARYRSARLADFSFAPVRPNTDGLFVTGPAGVGKTHLATAWLAELMPTIASLNEHGGVVIESPCWTSVPDLLCELRSTFGRGASVSEAEVLRRYRRAPLLVLDDLGAQKVTDWTVESLYVLVSGRINACLPTIVTSNLRLEDLDSVDSRLASRLGGMAYQKLEGEDRRLKS